MNGVHDLGHGVYFARRDQAGFLRRLVIIAVDLLFIVMVGFVIQMTWDLAQPEVESRIPGLVWFGFAYLYLTILRGARLRTLGYIVTGVRIVNLKGGRPSLLWMNLRFAFSILGPFNLILDLTGFWGDDNRQMLRDRLAGTYVIRRGAIPIGKGPIRPTTLFILGYTLAYPEVIRNVPTEAA